MTTNFFKQIVNQVSNAKSVVITLMAVVCLLFALPQGVNGEERFIVGFAPSAGSYTNGIGETQTAVTHPGNGTSNAPSVVVNGYAAYDITLNTSNAYTTGTSDWWSGTTTYSFCNANGIAIAGDEQTNEKRLTYTAPTGVYFSTKTHFKAVSSSTQTTNGRAAYFACDAAASTSGHTQMTSASTLYTNAKVYTQNTGYGWWKPLSTSKNSFFVSVKNTSSGNWTKTYYYGILNQSWFYFKIPEVLAAASQDYGEPRGYINLGKLAKNITTSTQTVTVKVADGVNASDFNVTLTNNGVGSFSTVSKSLNAAGTELTLTFTFSSGNVDGAINAELYVESVNTLDTKDYYIDIAGTVGNAKENNPLAWNIDAAQSINSEYSISEYLTNIVSPEAISISVTDGDASVVEIVNGGSSIRFKKAGTVELTVVQGEGDEYEGKTLPRTFVVSKRTATFNFSETTLFVNTTYPNLITCPQDVNGTLMSLLNYSGASSYMTVDGSGNVTTLGTASNSVTLTITFAGNAEWNPINTTQTFKIVHPLPQPEFCLSGLDDIATRAVDGVFIQQEGSNGSYTWTGSALQLVSPNSISYWSECTFVVIHFDGVPYQLRFTPSARTYIKVDESADGENWTTLYQNRPSNTNQMTYSLTSTTRYVRIGVGRYSNTTTCNLNNLCVTGQPSFAASPATVTVYTDGTTSTPATITLTHNDMTSISVTSIDSKLQAGSFSVVSGEAIGANNKGTVSFDVNYKVPDANPGTSRSTTLTLTGNKNGGGTVTQNVTVNIEVVHATHYAKAQAEVIESGTGQVFVGKNSTEPASNQYRFTHSATQACSGEMGEDDDLTFWYWSKAAEGFELEGWYNDAEMTSPANSAEHFSTTVHATSTDEAHPTTRTIYANFVESAAQDKPKFTIADLDLGSMVSCSGTTLTQNLVLQPEGEAIRPLYIDPDQISVSFSSAPGHGDEWQYFSKGDYVKGTKSFPIYFNQDCINPTTHTYQATATVTATNEFGTTTKSVLVSATITPAALATFSVPSSLAFSTTLYSNQTQSLDAVLSSITNASGTPEISFSGTDAGSFSAVYDETNHKFVITFAPVAHKNPYSATATITVRNCDNVTTTHTITLSGGCQAAPAAAFTIGDHTFANKYRNQTDTWNATITGISNAYGDWTITKKSGDACITVGSVNQAAHTFVATFAPMAWGPYSATFTITFYNYDGVATSKDITLSGTCIEAPAADFTIGNHTFEDTQKNETDTWNATITGITNAYGDWTITKKSGDACITVGSVNQAAHTFVATFAPTAWGDYSATFTITFYNYDDVITSKEITLTGKCVHAPSAQFDLSAANHTFADRERGETDTWTVTLSNITNASATVLPAVTITGTDYAYFSVGDYNEGAKSFTFTFEPLAVGGPYHATATVTMLNNDGDVTEKTIELTGTCIPSPAAAFDIQDAATSGTSVVNTSVYFGDFDPTEGDTKTFYLVDIANVKEGTVPTIELATSSEYILSEYNESTHSFTVSFTATDAMSGAQYGNISVSMVNNEGAKTTKSFSVSASIKEHAEFDVRVTSAGGEVLKEGTWAEGLAEANKAANAGSTITLMRNINLGTITVTNTISRVTTIDLNGYTLRAAVNKSEVPMLTFSASVTVKDSKTGGRIINEYSLNGQLRTITVSGGTFTLESGTITVNNTAQYASAAATVGGVAVEKLASCSARALHLNVGVTANINGGRLETYATRNAYCIVQASSAATQTAGTSVLNINGGEVYAEAAYQSYGLFAYGIVNMSGGVVTGKTNTGTVDAAKDASTSPNLRNGNARGMHLEVSTSATATSNYYATLNMTGGEVYAINERQNNVDNGRAYGIYFSYNLSTQADKTKTPDGTYSQKVTATGEISNSRIVVNSGTYYGFGVYATGSYNSFNNTQKPIKIKNSTIEVTTPYQSYGVYATCAINGTNGCLSYSDFELTDCNVTATTTYSSTAYAVYVASASTTIFKNLQPVYYGEYATAAKVVVNGGTYIGDAKTTSGFALCSAGRAKTTYDSESSITAERKLGGNEEAYPIIQTHGGTFRGIARNTSSTAEARAVSSGGHTTIDGGEFEAESYGRYAYGLYGLYGTLTATNAKVTATTYGTHNATETGAGTCYGVMLSCGIATPTGFTYRCEGELNNCDITATAEMGYDAFAVYTYAVSRTFDANYLRKDSLDGKWTHKDDGTGTYDLYSVIYPSGDRSVAGKVTINGCKLKAQTKAIQSAYGVYMTGPTYGLHGQTSAYGDLVVRNTTINVNTKKNAAYGIRACGPTVVDGVTATIAAETTDAEGLWINAGEATITNSTFNITAGTGTAYGAYAQVGLASNTSATTSTINSVAVTIVPAYEYAIPYYGTLTLGEGNVFDVKTTTGNTAYGIFLNASKANWTADSYNKAKGEYAYAARATVNGGKYTATAAGTTGYAIGLAAKQVQGSAVAQPELTVNDGKFKGTATSTYADINANGVKGHFVLNGGYYVHNTNLANYAAEDKFVFDLPSSHPVYSEPEGYRYTISSMNPSGEVCKVYEGNTLRGSYATLEEGLQYVNANTGKTLVVVMTANYVLPAGEYTLPSNATLLLPYKTGTGAGATSAIATSVIRTLTSTTPSSFRKLIFAEGANMTVKGKIETSAEMLCAGGGSAVSGNVTGPYGQIHMMEGSRIDLESGSILYAWGYITGEGLINAKKGTKIYEDFVLGYWRGGSASSDMLNNSAKAFFVTDYAYQNIECPILYRAGSQAYGYSGVSARSSLFDSSPKAYPVNNVQLVGISGDNALFVMDNAAESADTWVKKEYVANSDSVVWTMNSGASISNMNISLSGIPLVGSINMDSKNYNLPITTNFTIVLSEGRMNITNDALFMPGSKLVINKEATAVVASGKKLYFYDNQDWQKTGGKWYYPVTYSPSWGSSNPRVSRFSQTADNNPLPDAEVFVHGAMEVNGQLFTTGKRDGSANIHSTNEDAGSIIYNVAATADGTVGQCTSTNPDYVTAQTTSAQLKNGNGTYTQTSGTGAGYLYEYENDQWVCRIMDGCMTKTIDGSGEHYYVNASSVVEVEGNSTDEAYHSVANASRFFIFAENNTHNNASQATAVKCQWWEADHIGIINGVNYYMANDADYDNYGTYYYYDGTAGFWKPKYVTVTWKNWDGTTLKYANNTDAVDQVPFNTSPKFLATNPSRANDATYQYSWTGWRIADDPSETVYGKYSTLPIVDRDITFIANITSTKWRYTISFWIKNGAKIEDQLLEVGEIPVCSQNPPTKAPTADKEYVFSNWEGYSAGASLPAVSGVATYYAIFNESTRQYDVTFLDYDNTELHTEKVNYNTKSTYAVEPTRTDPADTYLYDFAGWKLQGSNTTGLQTVTGDQIYVAQYTSRLKWFSITFRDWDGSVIQSGEVLNGGTVTAPANPSRESDAQYTYAFSNWSPAFSATATESKTYTAQYTPTTRNYTIRFVNYDDSELQSGDWAYGSIPAYSGATPSKPNNSENSYTFVGWDDIIREVTGTKTYKAVYTPVLLDGGPFVDITDVNNTEHKLTLNVNSWPSSGWPYTVKYTNTKTDATASASYEKGARTAERQLIVPYAGDPGDQIIITVKKTGDVFYSQHKYTIPTEVKTNANVSALSAKGLIYVKPGATLTINADTKSQNIYVAPDAKLVIGQGAKLSVDTLFLRTTPWASAEFENNHGGTLSDYTQICYTRIISDKTQAYQFGLPMRCDLSTVRLSDGTTPTYGNGWLLRSYSESHRAQYGTGAGIDNWETLKDADKVIQATVGYEMFSNSNYYREYYFPVVPTRSGEDVPVKCTSSDAKVTTMGAEHEGWNVLVSPFTHRYTQNPAPEGIVLSWLQPDGTYIQEPVTEIRPAIPFYYQAKANGYISFGETMSVPTLAPVRRYAATEEPERIQWVQLDIKDANGVGDQTSIYSHPTRYDEVYQTGIDVAKQSLTATRAIIYSSHAYGDMAFAGVADSLLEQGIALTVYSPSAQELIISMRENEWLNRMEEVWLVDKETGMRVDLLWSDYAFRVPEGTTSGRLFIQGVFRAPQVPTDIQNGNADGEKAKAQKVIINDKIYILVNGRMYDATGKLVNQK